jgi:hypothetical protein
MSNVEPGILITSPPLYFLCGPHAQTHLFISNGNSDREKKNRGLIIYAVNIKGLSAFIIVRFYRPVFKQTLSMVM